MKSPQKSEFAKTLVALEELNQTLFELINEFYPQGVGSFGDLHISWDGMEQAYTIYLRDKQFLLYKWRPNLREIYDNLDMLVEVFQRLVEVKRRRLEELTQRFKRIDRVLAPHYIAKNLRG